MNKFSEKSLYEKFDDLFARIEETVCFWDDAAAVSYREKMRSLKKDIEITLKENINERTE